MNSFIWRTEEESPQGFDYPDPPEELEVEQQPSDRSTPQPQQQQQAIAQQQKVDAQRQAETLARLQQMAGSRLPQPMAIASQSQPKRDMLPIYLGGGMIGAFFLLGMTAIIVNSLPSAQQARQSETIAAIAMEATRHKSNIVCVFDCSSVAEVMQQQNQPAQIQGQHVQVASGAMDRDLYLQWVQYWASEAQRLPPSEFEAIAASYQPSSIEDQSAFQFVVSSIQQQ